MPMSPYLAAPPISLMSNVRDRMTDHKMTRGAVKSVGVITGVGYMIKTTITTISDVFDLVNPVY